MHYGTNAGIRSSFSDPHFSWRRTEKPIIALAPMAGITDGSYRQFIKSIAPEIIVYSEIVRTDGPRYGSTKTREMLSFDSDIERPFIVQVFGKNREHFIHACREIEDMGADGIDINMGCPAAKVVSSCHGSALMRDADLAASLVDAVASTVRIPVSVKTRIGWSSPEELIPFCKRLIDAGASALAIHGRTYTQKFKGIADWNPIYALKNAVDIPVIGNGDIWNANDACSLLQNLDGVMVGRATMGNPWIMADIVSMLRGNSNDTPSSLPFQKKIPFILRHCELAVRHKG
jgi:tRNA-dihydrouridine synthase B